MQKERPHDVVAFDTHALLCEAPPRACTVALPGTAVAGYEDEAHLSYAGAIYLWPHLCAALPGTAPAAAGAAAAAEAAAATHEGAGRRRDMVLRTFLPLLRGLVDSGWTAWQR